MKNKRLLILLLIIIFVGVFFYLNQNQKGRTQISPTPSIVVTKTIMDVPKDQIEEYYQVYQNPAVIFLRKALNAYLENNGNEICILKIAAEKNSGMGIISGLVSFSKEYYKSKFVVATINDNSENGQDIQIIFQDKPDRIFYAWVGKNPEGVTCLIGFNSKENIDQKALKEMTDYFGPLLFDKTHAL